MATPNKVIAKIAKERATKNNIASETNFGNCSKSRNLAGVKSTKELNHVPSCITKYIVIIKGIKTAKPVKKLDFTKFTTIFIILFDRFF